MATHTESGPSHSQQLREALPLKLARDDDRYIRLAELVAICAVGKSYVYAGMKNGTFPKCLHLPGGKVVAWRARDIREWMAAVEDANKPKPAAGPDLASQGGAQ